MTISWESTDFYWYTVNTDWPRLEQIRSSLAQWLIHSCDVDALTGDLSEEAKRTENNYKAQLQI